MGRETRGACPRFSIPNETMTLALIPRSRWLAVAAASCRRALTRALIAQLGCLAVAFVLVACSFAAVPLRAEDAKPADNTPKILVTLPLTIVPGHPQKLILRGLKLEDTSEVRFDGVNVPVTIVNKGKAPIPDKQEPAVVGDTQVEIEFTLPADTPAGLASLIVVTPAGASPAKTCIVCPVDKLTIAREPASGFRDAQPIAPGQTVEGAIQEPRDVDVFRLSGQAGQHVTLEIEAARLGSALDSVVTLYDAQGRIMAVSDDHGDSVDSRLEHVLPSAGDYFVAVIDANDRGGPVHLYRLLVGP